MTTYVAKQVIGSNVAQNPAGALLQSGANRANNSATGDTWLFLNTVNSATNPWGIFHSQVDNKIKIIGDGTDDFWVDMDTGDTYILGNVGIGYDPETSGNTYKLYVNGDTYFNGNTTHNGIDYFANGTTYYINNSANGYLNNLQLTADLTFDSTGASGTTGTSGGIYWSGSTDAAQIYYTVPASDQGNLVINMTDDANARISLRTQGTERIGIDSNGTYINTQLQRGGKSVSWFQGRNAAIIKTTTYSGYDAILSIKTTSGDWSQGVYTNNIMYWTYITDTNYNSNTNTITSQMYLTPEGHLHLSYGNLYIHKANSGIYYQGANSTFRMIRFIEGDANGQGISIGGGGLTILGSGESADTIIANVTSAGATETTYIASDNNIQFYPGQQSYDASALVSISPSRIWAGVNGNTVREAQVGVQSGAGQVYLWSAAATGGDRGLYLPAHGSGGAFAIIRSNTNNSVTILGNDVWGSYVRLVDNWVGFYNARQGGTRYGYVQANANRMYFRKENGVSTYAFDFNGHIYTSNNLYCSNVTIGSTTYNNGWIELYGSTPFIDFHFGNSTADYTSRIIENVSGQLYISGKLKVATSRNGYALNAASFICDSWIRTVGATGWYNESYGGGWYMEDTTWIRSYNSKSVYVNTTLRADGDFWGCKIRCNANWIGFYSANGGGTRYGYIQTDSARMYFRKENGVSTYHFDMNGGYLITSRCYNAIWNDFAECREVETEEPGFCVTEAENGKMIKTTERLQAGCKITSDTYGTCIGQTQTAKTPIAVSGRVLVYTYKDRNEYPLGAAVCSAPNGTIDLMTRDEIMMYPERIVGTVSEIPKYEIWHCGSDELPEEIKVNGRIWVYVK